MQLTPLSQDVSERAAGLTLRKNLLREKNIGMQRFEADPYRAAN